jgi:hypothetical protein
VGLKYATCDHDGEGEPTELELQVCHSAAGYYLGTWCDHCGPYSRNSDYMRTREDAEAELKFVELTEGE